MMLATVDSWNEQVCSLANIRVICGTGGIMLEKKKPDNVLSSWRLEMHNKWDLFQTEGML